jgi:hypothetical protein
MVNRRIFMGSAAVLALSRNSALSAALRLTAQDVLQRWYGLALELVRHTAPYSPPVASRTFAYLGIVAYESVASGGGALLSLTGQLPDLKVLPMRQSDAKYDEANVMHGALHVAVQQLFNHTGPTGMRASKALGQKMDAELAVGLSASRVKRSRAYGAVIAQQVLAWSKADGGANVVNLGFPEIFKPVDAAGHWKPTSVIRMQQAPLLPKWGENRTFAIGNGAACSLPPPPVYSEDKASEFYKQAFEVYDAVKNITPEKRVIARFWSGRSDAVAHAAGALDVYCFGYFKVEECQYRRLCGPDGAAWHGGI